MVLEFSFFIENTQVSQLLIYVPDGKMLTF